MQPGELFSFLFYAMVFGALAGMIWAVFFYWVKW